MARSIIGLVVCMCCFSTSDAQAGRGWGDPVTRPIMARFVKVIDYYAAMPQGWQASEQQVDHYAVTQVARAGASLDLYACTESAAVPAMDWYASAHKPSRVNHLDYYSGRGTALNSAGPDYYASVPVVTAPPVDYYADTSLSTQLADSGPMDFYADATAGVSTVEFDRYAAGAEPIRRGSTVSHERRLPRRI